MRTFATLALFVALAVGGACSKEEKGGGGGGGGAATCEAAAKKIAVLEDPGDTPEAKAKQDETVKDVMGDCERQKWSPEVLTCIVSAKTEDELNEKCKPLLGK